MSSVREYTSSELLAVTSARLLPDRRRVFAGIGLPTLAVALAQATTAPDLELIYESGVCGAHPTRLPETVADASIVTGAESVLSMATLFGYVLQGGHVNIGFLGAAQIDRVGNLNSTVIGPYDTPSVRLPGSGGAAEVIANAGEVFVVLRRHDPATFVDRVDFITSSSRHTANGRSPSHHVRGAGVTTVLTDLGLMRTGDDGELELAAVQHGVTPADVIAATGWTLRARKSIEVIPPPTEAELNLLRTSIDPKRVYLR